jgi:hypothetical protein
MLAMLCWLGYKDCMKRQNKRMPAMTTKKPTIFIVTDVETTMGRKIVFDIAWKAIDRKGRVYGSGSYLIREAFHHDVPWFKDKMGLYYDDAYHHRIVPSTIFEARDAYNALIKSLRDAGHRVILAAYNSRFDFEKLPFTVSEITGDKSMSWLDAPAELMDIWDYWGESVPRDYVRHASTSASGKYVSTTAENAYRYEANQPEFVEYHRAWHDVEIESEILLKALSRKKKMSVVNEASDLVGAVWKKINTRLGVDGKTLLPVAA